MLTQRPWSRPGVPGARIDQGDLDEPRDMIDARRDQTIDQLRGVSIILVLLHHFNIAYRLEDTALARAFGWDAVHAVVRNGNYGVTIFFVISGYLITSNAERRFGSLAEIRPLAFWRLRAARIVPCVMLLVAIVNAAALTGLPIFRNQPEFGPPVPFWLADLASITFWINVLMAHAGWFNYVLCVQWSLAVEEIFYFAFPILCALVKRDRWLLAVWLLFIVAGPLWRATHQNDERGFLFAYLACFDGIAIGCCAALLRRRMSLRARPAMALRVVAAAGMAVVYLAWPIGEANVWGVSIMAAGTAIVIAAGGAAPGRTFGGVLVPVTWCGRLSYELYLFHLLPLAVLRTVWPPERITGDAKLALMAGYLTAAAAFAALVAHWYSDPLNRRFRSQPRLQVVAPAP